jgi:L-alanine-DL-glutamate epimerase-like enolase superfamily enzyme
MANFWDTGCCGCGMWSHGSPPVSLYASIQCSRIRARAVSLDSPFRTEQKNVGNAVVMQPRQGPQDDFVGAGAAHGIGKISAEFNQALSSLETKPIKLLNPHVEPK